LAFFRGGDSGFVVSLPLLGRVPVQAHLNGRRGTVGCDGDLDGVRSGRQVDFATHVVDAIGRRHDVVLIGLQDISVHRALRCAGACQALVIDLEAGIGAQGLKVNQ